MVAIRRIFACFDGAPNATLREDFTYDAAGRRVSDARYDDLSASTLIARTTTTYDALGRILGLETRDASNTLVADFDYTYDAAGRLTSKSDDGALTTYSYDSTNQLTGEDAASNDRTYSYDANGNRTMSGYSHGTDNRLTTDGTWNYTYNDEGAMIEKERISDGLTWFYAYDHRNQLTKLDQSDNGTDIDLRIEYKYDAWGNRIARSIDRDADGALNPEVMQFALDGWNPAKPAPIGTENVDVWADLEIDGTLATRYLRSDRVDELLARIDDLTGDPTKSLKTATTLCGKAINAMKQEGQLKQEVVDLLAGSSETTPEELADQMTQLFERRLMATMKDETLPGRNEALLALVRALLQDTVVAQILK